MNTGYYTSVGQSFPSKYNNSVVSNQILCNMFYLMPPSYMHCSHLDIRVFNRYKVSYQNEGQ